MRQTIFRTVSASVGLLLLLGCNRAKDPGHGSAHAPADEPKMAQVSVWTDRHEIFAEHRLVVAGAPTRFVTHVTDLKTLEPRREGPIRFQFALGQEPPLEHIEKTPSRAGIYEPKLTFPKAGEWNVSVFIPTDGAEAELKLPPVKVFATADAAAHAEVPEPPDGISFLKEQQWKVLSGTGPVGKRRLVEQLRLPATTTAKPGTLAAVTPPINGRLLLPPGKTMPLVGDKVQAGQTLALLQPTFGDVAARFVEAEAAVTKAKVALDQTRTAFERVRKLAEQQARSQRELQEAESAFKTAQANHDAALALQATYRQAGTNLLAGGGAKTDAPLAIELRSPIAGTIVSQSGAAVGEFIAAEKAVFTVLDASTVFLEVRIPEANVQRLSAAKSASYESPAEPGRFVPVTGDGGGRLVFLSPQVDAVTRTVALVYEVKNAAGALRVGQAVNLFVETSRVEDALAVPGSAIVEEDGRPIAFVQVAGETFQKRDLTLGVRDGHWVQVLAGLAEGERVVTKGAYAVRLASVSSAIPAHGHVH
ncbi:MAG: efflux RND transporter periplasmic adaptor subunit [Verrucomicrobia bacterium]|nr:efflux RND transporter periplasmic adaptor subunit [Verrucomicrobiota bacterium]